ncbi:MAG: hypothetical protein HKN23_06830 [Verrucomicrobiales bacterium]|nr:hypothetical protein [Verrucomicrobiales bacterium]
MSTRQNLQPGNLTGRCLTLRTDQPLQPRLQRQPSSDYHFISHWVVDASLESVAGLLQNYERQAEWWQSVLLRTERLDSENPVGTGTTFRYLVSGFLPYSIQFLTRITAVESPFEIKIEAAGAFMGEGFLRLNNTKNSGTRMDSEWKIRARHPLIRRLSFLFRPVFAQNHIWAMQRGEKGLSLALAKPDLSGDDLRKQLPRPTFPHNLSFFTRRIRWKPWTKSWEAAYEYGNS